MSDLKAELEKIFKKSFQERSQAQGRISRWAKNATQWGPALTYEKGKLEGIEVCHEMIKQLLEKVKE